MCLLKSNLSKQTLTNKPSLRILNHINPKYTTQHRTTLQNKMTQHKYATQHVFGVSSPHSLYVVPSSMSPPLHRIPRLMTIATVTLTSAPPHTCVTHTLFSPRGSPHHDLICLFRRATIAPIPRHHHATTTLPPPFTVFRFLS